MFGRSAGRILTTASRRTSLAGRARLQAISPPRAGPSTSFARFITSDKGDSLVHPTQQPSTSPDRLADAANDAQASDSTSGAARDAATVSQKDDKEEQERFGTEEHTLMSEQEKEILHKLLKEFPGGSVAVQDTSGGCGSFFSISVESERFKGLSRIKQHQLVNKILADELKTWHGVQVSQPNFQPEQREHTLLQVERKYSQT